MSPAARAVLVVALAASAGAGIAAASIPRIEDETPGRAVSSPDRARLEDYFTPEDVARAGRYRGPRYALGFGALGVRLLALALVALGPAARLLSAWSGRAARGRWWAQTPLLVLAVTAVPALLTTPFAVARHRHDDAFGLATNSTGEALADLAKATGFELVVATIAALAFVGLARAFPRRWPLAAGAAGALLAVALVFLFPVVYEPAFNRFAPVDAETRARVQRLARAAGVDVRDVLVADASRRTTRQNAYVSGFGATKRVVLYDTLLRKSSAPEVDLVVAHELAHEAHHDVLKGTAYSVAGVAGAVFGIWLLLRSGRMRRLAGAGGAGDPAVVPFLALFLGIATLVVSPLATWISRDQEARADRTAIALTGDPETAVELEVNLARDNIADLEPNGFIRWAFFTHPAPLERIQIALDAGARPRP